MSTPLQNEACAWLGQAQLQETNTDTSWLVHVAVWANDVKQAKEVLMSSIQGVNENISKIFKITPADDSHHPEQQALARRVSPFISVALGKREALTNQLLEEYDDTEYLTITEHDIPPLEEQLGVPFWDREWIVPELKELLFGQSETGDVVRTYLVMDASARRSVTKFDDLSTIEIPMQCLFKGDAAEKLREVAPYLLDMTLPEGAWEDKDKVPHFHKDFFKNHWDKNTGILIRSAEPMDALHHHLRKLTKATNEQEKAYFIRFWEPRRIAHLLQAFGHTWAYCLLSKHRQLIVPAQTIVAIKLTKNVKPNQQNLGTFVLTDSIFEHLSQVVRHSFISQTAQQYSQEGLVNPEEAIETVQQYTQYFMSLGLTEEACISALIKCCLNANFSLLALQEYRVLFQQSHFDDHEKLVWFKKMTAAHSTPIHIRLDGSTEST